MKSIRVYTHPNIAICKYWGKRNTELLLPTKSSISIGLSALFTDTTVSISSEPRDIIRLNGVEASAKEARAIHSFLAMCRNEYQLNTTLKIESCNSFPHSAGMASSASGFAALAVALNRLLCWKLNNKKVSILARRGSGSACRSVLSGFVHWSKGERLDGLDSYARQVVPTDYWPELRIITVIVSTAAKNISSRDGMQISMATSPCYDAWIEKSERNIPILIDGIHQKNLHQVGHMMQDEWRDWVQVLETSSPRLTYFTSGTYSVIEAIKTLQVSGIACYYTTDAGPNVHMLCLDESVEQVSRTIRALPGVRDIIISCAANNSIIEELS